ncbi:MAG: InlB B-repeat-containing protein [Bacteroidales bacterium]
MKKIIFFIILCCVTLISNSQTLTNVTPSSALQGQLLTVSISGSNTHFTQASSTTIWFEQGSSTVITPFNVQAINNTTLSAFVQLSAQQITGLYNLHVSTSLDGNLVLPNSFTVLPNPNSAHLVSVTPNTASQGDVLSVTISGQYTNFNQGTNTICWFQQGSSTIIYPTNQTSINATSLIANYSIPSNAVTGYYNTFTYNSTDGLLQLNSSFLINLPNTYSIQASAIPANGGYVTGSGIYLNNQSCTLTANNYTGFYFVNWTENGNLVSTNSSYTFSVTSNRNITANFSPINQYYINAIVSPVLSGTISGIGAYNLNQLVTLHATAFTSWYFDNWTENGIVVSQDSIYSFSVISNKTLVANFKLFNSIPEFNIESDIIVYPNPAISFITIGLKNRIKDNAVVQIYDVLGKLVLSQIFTNEFPININVDALKNGVYYINVRQKNNTALIKKLLISK